MTFQQCIGPRRAIPFAALALLMLCVVLLSTAHAGPAIPTLPATVIRIIDGDTIEAQLQSGPIKVRFDSIDTPESNQAYGTEATAALKRMLPAGAAIDLEPITQDRYERMVAVVWKGDLNVNVWLVAQGYAWAFRRYMKDPGFCAKEQIARTARRGLWSQSPREWIYPSDFRRHQRDKTIKPQDFSHETAQDCVAAMGKR